MTTSSASVDLRFMHGLMTYDRAIVKFDVDTMAQIHRRLR